MSKKEPVLQLKFFSLLKFHYQAVKHFRKEHKYTLGERILKLNWSCLSLVTEANACVGKRKVQRIRMLSARFDQLKMSLRIAQELDLLSEKQFTHIHNTYLREIGRIIGGWIKNPNGK